jgi:hypothetical protein
MDNETGNHNGVKQLYAIEWILGKKMIKKQKNDDRLTKNIVHLADSTKNEDDSNKQT